MSSPTHLVLLTQGFPYGQVEPFIDTELVELAQRFSRVTVVPLTARAGRPIRQLPPGVELEDIFPLPRRQIGKIVAELPRALHMQKGLSARQKLFEALWLTKMAALAAQVRKRLAAGDERRIYYGYWLSNTAAVAQILHSGDERSIAVARGHGGDIYMHRAARGFHPGRRHHRQLRHVFPVSNAGVAALQEQGFDPTRLSVARLGVTQSPIAKYVPDHQWRMVTCSNTAPVKRLDLIARAVALLADQGYPIRWLHVGDTQMPEGSLSDLLTEFGCTPAVLTATGHVPADQVRKQISEFSPHVFVNASSTEGVPVAVMEAFSLGLPVIATNAGGTGEIVTDNHNGTLLPVEISADDLADAIRNFAQLPAATVQSYRAAALTTWRSTCDAHQNYENFGAALVDLEPQ